MNKKLKLPIILSVIVLALIAVYISTSFSEKMVIRRTIFLHSHPIQAFEIPIQNKPDSVDEIYGDCYNINSSKLNNGTEYSIPGICMKKNRLGFIYQATIGVY